MKTINLIQGSKEWHEARQAHFCASEAPAMMNESKYLSRSKLLDQKSGAVKEQISASQQAIFDKGHKAEDMARQLLELDFLEDFPPLVCVAEVEGLKLLASLDGCNGSVVFEHKLLNQTLAENVANQVLEPHYYWQLEHQLLVSGLDSAIFVCSDGTKENWHSLEYKSQPERRKALILGWLQFAEDLKQHTVKPKAELVEAETVDLPAVVAEVSGSMITSNIEKVVAAVSKFAKSEISEIAETDQDFANKSELGKKAKKAREKLKKQVEAIKDEFVSFSEFSELAAELDSHLQKLQSDCERQVKTGKEAKKKQIAEDANDKISVLRHNFQAKIQPVKIGFISPVEPSFTEAMKGKRTISGCQEAVDAVVAQYKIDLNAIVNKVQENLDWYKVECSGYEMLFRDLEQVITQDEIAFKAVCKQRIAEHKEIEEQRQLEQERAAAEEQPAPEAPVEEAKQPEFDISAPARDMRAEAINALSELCDIDESLAEDIVEQIALGNVPGVMFVG